jgi:NCAIR mutase (PurE)-related protein
MKNLLNKWGAALTVRGILEKVKQNKISVEDAEAKLKAFMIKNVEDFAKLDVNRHLRKGFPEIVFAENKTPKETLLIAKEMMKHKNEAIITRTSEQHIKELKKLENEFMVEIHKKARTVVVKKRGFTPEKTGGQVAILTAGTADIPVAEEAKVIAEEMGCTVHMVYDVGVAGLHRLFQPLQRLIEKKMDVCIVVAGMEGALPSVVAGLVDVPIIGVPTSTGYGYGGKGECALMSMLQSCSLGIGVVNIDNGVGAGALAALIANRASKNRKKI